MNAVLQSDHPVLLTALEAADAGLAVVWQQGKRAIATGWNKGPALTADELQNTFRPGLNCAFRAGPTSRLRGWPVAVVDVDIRSTDDADREEARAAYKALVGDLKPTVQTGGGGVHLYLRFPPGRLPSAPASVLRQSEKRLPSEDPNKPGKPAWTIELLSGEHAVTMPPSVHPSGKSYQWKASLDDVQDAPESLLMLLPESPLQPDAGRSAPEPLRRPVPPAKPYPLNELGEVLRPAAEAIRRVIQAPDAIIGGSLLAAASLAVQAQADVHIDGRVYPLSLWLLNVAESGERKSAVDAEAMRAARVYEVELGKGYEAEMEIHAAELAQWEAQRDAAKADAKKAKGEGLADKLRKLGPPPPAPLLPRVTAADFTAEGIFKLLGAGRPTIGAFTDEAALVFGGHGMSKETVMRTAGTLCKLWDNGSLDRVRSGDGAQKLYGRRFALHLLAQPVIAERALSDDVLAGQGFLARCLLAWPQGTAGSRAYRAENLRNDLAVQRLDSVLLDRHRQSLPLAEGERQTLAPRALALDADAKAAWIALYSAVESHCGPGQHFAQVKPWASKTPEQALRIAGVLTLLEDAGATSITGATMERAAELALWHLNEAVRLAGTAELSPEVRDAEALLEWAHATGRNVIYSSEALQVGPNRVREREVFLSAIGELVRAGWAIPVDGGMVLDGKHRRHVWRIAPASEGR